MAEMTTVALAEVRANLAGFVDAAQRQGRRTTITRDGRPVAVLLAVADLESLERTATDGESVVARRGRRRSVLGGPIGKVAGR
jgi:prevent-host-death family protein